MVKEGGTGELQEKPSVFGLQSRRTALKRLLGFYATTAGVLGVVEAGIHWKDILSLANFSADTYQKVTTAKGELDKIYKSLSKESELLSNVYRRGEQIDLSRYQDGIDIEVFGLGDSNFYMNGIKNDTKGPDGLAIPYNQPNSFLEQAGDSLTDTPETLSSIGVSSWKTFTYAVPGAPSSAGFKGDRQYGLLGPEQIKNPDFQNKLRNGSQLKIVNIGLHGDDWRELATDAFELAALFKTFQLNKITDADIAKLKALKAKSDAIAKAYGEHMKEALQIIARINDARIKEGLPDIKVVINYPISNLHVDHIPFRTLKGDESSHPELSKIIQPVPGEKDRYYLNLNQIQDGQQIAYVITDSIYKQLSSSLPDIAKQYPSLDMYSVVWMGLEKQKNLFFIDGHLNEAGITSVKKLFLQILKKKTTTGKTVSLDKIISHT